MVPGNHAPTLIRKSFRANTGVLTRALVIIGFLLLLDLASNNKYLINKRRELNDDFRGRSPESHFSFNSRTGSTQR